MSQLHARALFASTHSRKGGPGCSSFVEVDLTRRATEHSSLLAMNTFSLLVGVGQHQQRTITCITKMGKLAIFTLALLCNLTAAAYTEETSLLSSVRAALTESQVKLIDDLPRRNLQNQDICSVLLQNFDATRCTCGPSNAFPGEIALVCADICTLCLDPPVDFCATPSLELRFLGFLPTFQRLINKQEGADSSNTEVVIEDIFVAGAPLSCTVTVNGSPCNPCQIINTCTNGRIFDCSNLGYEVFNTCNVTSPDSIPLDSPFAAQVRSEFDFSQCPPPGSEPSSAPTEEPVGTPPVPPKKTPFDESEDFRFYDLNARRGGITRRLLRWLWE